MARVKAVKPFADLVERVDRAIGDEWEVTADRLAAINGTQFGILVEEVADGGAAPAKAKTTRRRTTKNTGGKSE